MYEVGDKVVYPHHGAGTVVRKEERDEREYLTIQIIHNDMTVMIPSDSADRAGLRKVIGEETVEEVLGVEEKEVKGLRVREVTSGDTSILSVEGMFLGIGHEPNAKMLLPIWKLLPITVPLAVRLPFTV